MRSIVTVIGKDTVGIIASVCAILAAEGVNILDISQTVLQDYFTMIMIVDTAECKISFAELSDKLRAEGEKKSLDIRTQREDIFEALHRI